MIPALTRKAVLVVLFALVTAKASAVQITYGSLTTDTTSTTIIDSRTGIEYLRFDVLANLTYAQTLDEAGVGGTYYGWHIASQEEAFAFMNSALFGSGNAFVDSPGHTNVSLPLLGYQDGDFGSNHRSDTDSFWFLAEEGREVGWAVFTPYGGNNITIDDYWNSIAASDLYAAGGEYSYQPVSWLLVKDKISPIPEPTTMLLLGSGLAGLAAHARRRKK